MAAVTDGAPGTLFDQLHCLLSKASVQDSHSEVSLVDCFHLDSLMVGGLQVSL